MAVETVTVRLDETWKPISLDNAATMKWEVVGWRDAIFAIGDSAPAAGTSEGMRDRSIPPTVWGTAKVYARAVRDSAAVSVTRTVNAGNATTATLQKLSLSAASFATNAASGSVIGSVQGKTAGSALQLLTNTKRVALTSDGASAVVGLEPGAPGKFTATVRESLAGAADVDTTLEFTVTAPALTISGSAAGATEGQDYAWRPTVGGGYGDRSYRLAGSLPTGWSMSSATGAIYAPAGFVRAALGTISGMSITVTDEAGQSATLSNISINISGGGTGPSTGRLMVAGTRLQPLSVVHTTTSTTTYGVSEVHSVSADYAQTELWFGFMNSYTVTSGELDTGNAIEVKGVSVSINGGAWQRVTTTQGDTGAIIADGGFAAFKYVGAVPANSLIAIRTHRYVAEGLNCPSGYRMQTQNGECYAYSGSSLDALLDGGTMSTFLGGTIGVPFGPVIMLGKGWDGRPAVLTLGDSQVIGGTEALSADAAGNQGWLEMGLYSPVGGRQPFANFNCPGTAMSNSTGIGAGQMRRKFELLKGMMALNNQTDAPFDRIISTMGGNDMGQAFSVFVTRQDAWLAFLRAQWPGVKVGQSAYWCKTAANDNCWTDTTTQVTASAFDAIDSTRGLARRRVLTGAAGFDFTVDSLPYMAVDTSTANGFVWNILNPPFSTTLAAAAAINTRTVSLVDKPAIYSQMAFEPGDATNKDVTSNYTVLSVTGTGPYAVTFSQNLGKAHAQGTVVKKCSSRDGLHPVAELHRGAVPAVEAMKMSAAYNGQAAALRAIGAYSSVPTGVLAVSAGRSRMKVRQIQPIRRAISKIGVIHAGRYLVSGSGLGDIPNAVTLKKGAFERVTGDAAGYVPVTWAGTGTDIVVPPGAVEHISDIQDFVALPGDQIAWRAIYDVPSSGSFPITPWSVFTGDQIFLYDPANELDDVYATGAMATPTGATASGRPYCPAMIVGLTADGNWSVLNTGTSIDAGQNCETPNVLVGVGGGYAVQAAMLKKRPCMNYALNGYKANDVIASHNMLDALAKYFEAGSIGAPTNDTYNQGLSNITTLVTKVNTIAGYLKAAGAKRVVANTMLPRGTCTDKGVLPENFTPYTEYLSGGLRDLFNDALKAKGAGFSNVDVVADVSPAAEDPGNKNKWATRPYASTLAAAMVSTANVASVVAAPPLYESLAFDPANTNSQLGPTSFFGVRSISGTGPFTVGTGGATQVGVAQNSGNVVRGRSSDGGTHPLELTTTAMGAILAQALV